MAVTATFKADFSDFLAKVDEAQGQLKTFGQTLVGAFSVHQVTAFVSTTTKAFAEEEAALSRLTTALQGQGQATAETIAQYEALAATFQRTTTFSDDLILEMEALLVQVGQVAPEQMEAALTAATNLAAGLDIDLRTATLAVAKAFEGGTGQLTKMVPALKDVVKEGATTEQVLQEINVAFGPQAQSAIDTYAGKMQQAGNAFNEAQERAGGLFVKGLSPLLDVFIELPGPIQTTIGVVGTLTPSLDKLLLGVIALGGPSGALAAATSAFGVLSSFVVGSVLPWLTVSLPSAFLAIVSILGVVGTGGLVAAIAGLLVVWYKWDEISAIVQRVYQAVKTWLLDQLTAVFNSIRDRIAAVTGYFKGMYDAVVGQSYVPDMVRGIQASFSQLDAVMVQPTRTATSTVTSLFATMGTSWQGMAGQAASAFGPGGISGAATSMAQSVTSTLLGMIPIVGGIASKFAGPIVDGFKKIGSTIKDLFSGPSADELAGRQVVDKFQGHLKSMLNETQKMEAGNEQWKATVIAIRDAYAVQGLSAEEAMADAQRLWGATGEGAAASQAAVELVNQKMKGFTDQTNSAIDQARGLADALHDVGRAADNIHFPSGSATVGVPGYAQGTGGRYVNFGQGTLALLHGRERVMTEGEAPGGDPAMLGALQAIRRDLQRQPELIALQLRAALAQV